MTESKPVDQRDQPAVSRREFLYYIWSASAALLFVEAGAGIGWFWSAQMRPRSTTLIELDLKELPTIGDVFYVPGRFWLFNVSTGLIVWRRECSYCGCLFKVAQPTSMNPYPLFICPCCGSRFTFYGNSIYGPANRNLDRFRIIAYTSDETRQTDASDSPMNIDGVVRIQVDTEVVIYGAPRPNFE
jgi:hypothetical protein